MCLEKSLLRKLRFWEVTAEFHVCFRLLQIKHNNVILKCIIYAGLYDTCSWQDATLSGVAGYILYFLDFCDQTLTPYEVIDSGSRAQIMQKLCV